MSKVLPVDHGTDGIIDEVDTSFWSAPSELVLVGLTRNNKGTTTTGALAPVTPLLGGSDAINNAPVKTIICMVRTVIDPSESTQPHSALKRKLYRHQVAKHITLKRQI
ncbi:hypothetical protein N8Z70_00915 [Candidatus Puniceispirillum sp.]|nr:hypothetical protein [Alphaproteobacteria bacterium]MDC1293588.1 hypothetical protein [Candidatus Puniceispirillum sp.]